MNQIWIAGLAGIASGLLGVAARRHPLVAWVALSPLGVALLSCGWRAALAGAIVGGCLHGVAMITQPAKLRPLGAGLGALGWSVTAAVGGSVLDQAGEHALVAVLAATAVIAPLPMRWLGAPRWVHGALACTQEVWPVVIRAGWIGGELTVHALLGAIGAAVVLVFTAPLLSAAVFGCVGLALFVAALRLERTRAAIARARRVRIAAVVVNGAPPDDGWPDPSWPARSPEYRDVPATIARYTPYVTRAAAQGAELVVLPEVCVIVDAAGASLWRSAVREWAGRLRITLVAPFLDVDAPCNALYVAEPCGRVRVHDKQHPAPGLEPVPRNIEAPGPHRLETGLQLSTAICVDLDYADLVSPVRTGGGLLVAPSNDWPGGFDALHDRTAVWAALLTGATVLRATGHGYSSVRDGAGTLLARSSSLEGPVVLVVDAPLSVP